MSVNVVGDDRIRGLEQGKKKGDKEGPEVAP